MHPPAFALKMLVRADGSCPVERWFASLRDREASVVPRVRLGRLRRGLFGDCKSVGRGVSELRVDDGPGYRIHFARAGKSVIVLIAGGDKRTQQADIQLAHALWEEHHHAVEGLRRDFR